MEFVFNIDPVAKGRPRFTRGGRAYTPERTRKFTNELIAMMQWQVGEPLEGALKVEIVFYMRRPKSVKRKYPTVKPDLDNLEKALYDAGNGILWNDDSQIVTHTVSKYYADSGSIYMKVTKLK